MPEADWVTLSQGKRGPVAAGRFLVHGNHDRGRLPDVQRQIVEMALNGSGGRDTARVIQISPTTVIAVLKKSRRAATRQPRTGGTLSCTRRRHARPTQARSRAG